MIHLLSPTKIFFEFEPRSSHKVVKLVLQPENDVDTSSSKAKVAFDVNRDLNHVLRKFVKQSLTSAVAIESFGSRWVELDLKNVKTKLKE